MRDLAFAGDTVYRLKGSRHRRIEPFMDLGQRPIIVARVLHLLQIANRHTARVAHKVWEQRDPLVKENIVGLGGRGAIGELGDHFRPHTVSIVLGNHILQRSRKQHGDG